MCTSGWEPILEAARLGLRWRIASSAGDQDAADEWIEGVRAAVGPALGAAAVLGTMPNIVANRLNSQYDIAGPSFVVTAEELSGLDALDMATRALRVGDIDAAMVGAVDLSCDPAHVAAARGRAPRPTADDLVMPPSCWC